MKESRNRKHGVLEEVVRRERVFEGVYLKLDSLTVRLPDGTSAVREIVLVRDAAAVLPLDRDGNVHLIRQHRAAIGKTLIEAPAGLVDADESIEDTARRECEEETGFRPKILTKLITYAHAEGYSTGFITLFVGTDLEYTGNTNLDASEFVEPVSVPFAELRGMVERNEIVDSKTILCTVLWAGHVKNAMKPRIARDFQIPGGK